MNKCFIKDCNSKQHENLCINANSIEFKMEWISVKDKLPELDTRILVYINDKKSEQKIYISYLQDHNAFYRELFPEKEEYKVPMMQWESAEGNCFAHNITHWIPLPNQPKDF